VNFLQIFNLRKLRADYLPLLKYSSKLKPEYVILQIKYTSDLIIFNNIDANKHLLNTVKNLIRYR